MKNRTLQITVFASFALIMIVVFAYIAMNTADEQQKRIVAIREIPTFQKAEKFFGEGTISIIGLPDSTYVIGLQVENKEEWGAKFVRAEFDSTFNVISTTGLLEGGLQNNDFDTIRLRSLENTLFVYGTSGDYFCGNARGDVFYYLYNTENGLVHKAHLYYMDGPPQLFLGGEEENYKGFFVELAKKSYPSLQITDKDREFE